MRSRRWLIVGLGAVLAMSLVVGFEAGRRYPWALIDRWRGRNAPAPPVGWLQRGVVPAARYEGAALVANGTIYIFGGFHERPLQALARVDVYDPSRNQWTRKADMPVAITHRNPVLVGDTVWFAGGFVGNNPGPATRETWKYALASDRWVAGPPLPEPQGGGALLRDGRHLHLIGGYGADRNTSNGEHWILDLDRQEASWRPAPALPRPRGHFAGVALNGDFYLIGGTLRHDPAQADVDWVDRYDPATERWSVVAALPAPRSHTEPGTFTHAGRIIVVGGRNQATRERLSDLMLSYDPIVDRWLPIGHLPEGRVAPLAAVLGDSLYFGVGSDATYSAHDSLFWIHSLAGAWQRLAPSPVAVGEITAISTASGVFVIGEGTAATLRYDPATDVWDEAWTRARRPVDGHHHAGEWFDGRWYVLGGLGSVATAGLVQIYDVAADRWSFGPNLPWGAGSASSAVIGGSLFVAGGIDGQATVGTAARLDPKSDHWVSIAPMPMPRNHAASATDGRRMYVFGGRGPGSGDGNVVANGFAQTQIYDPATDRWSVSGTGPTAPAPLPQARGGMGKALFVRGEFWVFGGETVTGTGATSQHVYDRVDIYDPVRDRWRSGPPMPTARHGIFPVLVGERIYIVNGGTHAGHSSSNAVEYLELDRVPAARPRE